MFGLEYLCVRNYCPGISSVFSKISVHTAEYLNNQLFLYENLVVFDATCLSELFPERQSIFEDDTIFVCFVVLKLVVCYH